MERKREHRRERLGEALREEIAAIVEGELADPRIGLVGVAEVQVSPDGKAARVFINVAGNDAEAESSLEGLSAARAFIRHQVAERLQLRYAPELFFQLDISEHRGSRIGELLGRINKRKKK